MIIQVFSDESGFPDHNIQSICAIRGSGQGCNQLRDSVFQCISSFSPSDIKWSKIRAKKQLFLCVLDLFTVREERLGSQQGIVLVVGNKMLPMYKQLFTLLESVQVGPYAFFPDKNLTLKRHTGQHLFVHDNRFVSTTPTLMRDEPLLVLCDLLAGMYRECAERPFLKNHALDTEYLPDMYKNRLWIRRQQIYKQHSSSIQIFIDL